jgi:hypothetical protein
MAEAHEKIVNLLQEQKKFGSFEIIWQASPEYLGTIRYIDLYVDDVEFGSATVPENTDSSQSPVKLSFELDSRDRGDFTLFEFPSLDVARRIQLKAGIFSKPDYSVNGRVHLPPTYRGPYISREDVLISFDNNLLQAGAHHQITITHTTRRKQPHSPFWIGSRLTASVRSTELSVEHVDETRPVVLPSRENKLDLYEKISPQSRAILLQYNALNANNIFILSHNPSSGKLLGQLQENGVLENNLLAILLKRSDFSELMQTLYDNHPNYFAQAMYSLNTINYPSTDAFDDDVREILNNNWFKTQLDSLNEASDETDMTCRILLLQINKLTHHNLKKFALHPALKVMLECLIQDNLASGRVCTYLLSNPDRASRLLAYYQTTVQGQPWSVAAKRGLVQAFELLKDRFPDATEARLYAICEMVRTTQPADQIPLRICDLLKNPMLQQPYQADYWNHRTQTRLRELPADTTTLAGQFPVSEPSIQSLLDRMLAFAENDTDVKQYFRICFQLDQLKTQQVALLSRSYETPACLAASQALQRINQRMVAAILSTFSDINQPHTSTLETRVIQLRTAFQETTEDQAILATHRGILGPLDRYLSAIWHAFRSDPPLSQAGSSTFFKPKSQQLLDDFNAALSPEDPNLSSGQFS